MAVQQIIFNRSFNLIRATDRCRQMPFLRCCYWTLVYMLPPLNSAWQSTLILLFHEGINWMYQFDNEMTSTDNVPGIVFRYDETGISFPSNNGLWGLASEYRQPADISQLKTVTRLMFVFVIFSPH